MAVKRCPEPANTCSTSSSSAPAPPDRSWPIACAKDGKHTVLVLEYGGSDWGPFIQMPSALSYPMNMKQYDWGFVSEPEPHLGGRRLVTPRGKVIGGSSSINGMVYVRGHAKDYDAWEEMGARGLGLPPCAALFQAAGNRRHGGEEGWRGADGPLHVTRGRMRNPLYQAFIDAGREAGYPVTPDYNGHQQEGLGPFEMTVWKGLRWSSANAYLRPAIEARQCQARNPRARPPHYSRGQARHGRRIRAARRNRTARANREIVLAASAINSPKLLHAVRHRPADHLKDAGIAPVHDLPGVGQNLHDHLEILLQVECKRADHPQRQDGPSVSKG